MSTIKVVARFAVKDTQFDPFLNLAKELVQGTLKEEGCINYELVQDRQSPEVLMMVEEWESKSLLDKHMASEHFTRIVPQLVGLAAAEPVIHVCKKLA
ncbi:putative quinol monooxygenase [Sunxiuqinia sp. sy24]|uniref:putative quinol monooxygenase n=1 Tax=Sunxiuqinia sp. sy24 TaxID=3461495 RepID=UPI004045771E